MAMKARQVMMEDELWEELKEWASDMGVSTSSLTRSYIRHGMKADGVELEEEKEVPHVEVDAEGDPVF